MATITAPDFGIRSIQWTFTRPDSLATSGWTGSAVPMVSPWAGRWKAHVELAAIQGEANARTIKSFIARCKGSTQAFRLYATAGAQNSNTGVTVSSAASAGDTSVDISGAATSLLDGQMVTLNGQLLCLTADQSGSTLTFAPPLRDNAAVGTTVVTKRPYALVYMAASSSGWKIAPGRLFGIAFDVEEAVLVAETDVTPESAALLMETGDNLLLESGDRLLLE
jgi:hypothetical protein